MQASMQKAGFIYTNVLLLQKSQAYSTANIHIILSKNQTQN